MIEKAYKGALIGVDDLRHRTHVRRSGITKDTLHDAERRAHAARRCVICKTGMVQVRKKKCGRRERGAPRSEMWVVVSSELYITQPPPLPRAPCDNRDGA